MATSSCSELNQLTTAQESQHSHQPQDPLNLMHGGIFSHEYITYSIVIIIISIGMMMTLPKLSAMLQRFLQLKKLILDCQIPLEEIEPFIVDGQVFPPYIKELGWKFHVHTDKNHDQVHSPQDTSPFLLGERAVVIGGSIAGLLSASCLSPFFKEVVLIERSKYVEGESVVKHRHGDLPHILVNRGQSILEKLFPGIIQEVRTKSAQITLNPSSHQQYETPLERRSSNTCDQNDFKATSSTGDSMISKTQQQQFSDSSQQQHNSQKTIPSPPSPSRTTSSAKPYFVMKNFFNASEHLKLIYSSDQSQPLKRVQNGNHEVTIVSRGMWESTIRDYVFKATKNIKVYDGYQVLSNGKGIKLRVEPIRRGSSSDQQRQQQENQETQSLSSTQQFNVQVCGVIIQKVEKSNTTTGSLATTSTQHIHHHHTKGSQSNHSQDDTIELDCDLVVNCGGIHTCADYSKLLKGVEHAMIWATVDPSLGGSSTKTLSSTTIHGHEASHVNKTQPQNTAIPPQQQQQLLYSTRIDNKVRYHCFYFEPKDEAFDWFEKGIPGKLLRSPVTVVHDDDEEDPQDPKANSQKTKPYYAFYHLLTYPQTKGVLCIPMERNMFMINLITIADEEKENNRRISEGLTLENAKERIIEYYAKGAPFEKDLISVLNCMKDQPIRIPPPYEKEGNIFVHYEELLHYENPMNHHETFLSGFIAMGDSVSSMNPVYAQGMTTCLESTLILRESIKELLAQQLKKTGSRCTNMHTPKREEPAQSVPTTKGSSVFDHEFCSKFQQAIYYMLFIPWLMTSSDDIRYCDTEIPDRKHAPSSSRQQPSRHDNSHINHSKTYSRSCRWQKYMVAPLLDFMLYHIFSSGSTTEIVANYFYTILNMQDGFRTMPELDTIIQEAQGQIGQLQSRLQGCLGTDVSIVVDWATFEQNIQQDLLPFSYEVLCSWNGFLVLGKIVDTVQTMIQEYGGNAREVIARQLAQVRLQCIAVPPPKPVGKELTTAEKHKQKLEEAENPTKPTISLKDGAMTVSVQLGLGASGVPSYSYVSETLNALFGVSSAYYKKVLEDRIAKTKEEIKREVDDPNFDIEIVFDWESFQNAGNMDSALNNMARWDCWYSLQTLPRAFRWAKSDYPVTHERLKQSLKKVVFSNAEDDGVERRYWHSFAMLTNGTLEMRGVYREYWGYIYSYDVTRAVAYGCILDEADQAFENNETLDNEKLDLLVRAVREICSSSAVRYGNLKPLIELSKRKCFPQLDEIDQEAVDICLKTYHKEVMCKSNKKDEKKDKKDKKEEKKEEDDEDGDEPVHEEEEGEEKEEKQEYKEGTPFPETVIKAYSINKTNFRGQVQARLAVITNKALYTFAFDYKKKELIKRRAHRYVYNNIYSTRYGPLRDDNVQVVGGAAGAIANAAQDLMKDLSNYGLKIYTNIITSMKERMTEKAISKAVKKFVFKILKFLVEDVLTKAIGTEKEPVVDIPGLPKFNSPGFLLRTAATSLYRDKVDTQISVNGLAQANVAHSLEIAGEMFDTLSETIELDLPNLPNMKLTTLLIQICDILEQYNDDMDLNIPSSITISSLIRSINSAVYKLEQSGKNPTLEFEQPKELPYQDMIGLLKGALENYKNKTEFDNTAIKNLATGESFPKLPDLIEQLSSVAVPHIKFDPYPPVLVAAILKAIAGYLGKFNLPGLNLLELKIPGLSLPGLPRISLPGPPLPGILSRLKPPSEPSREEFIVQVNNPNKALSKFLSAQFCYLIYGAQCNDMYPYWPWSPYETSWISVPVSVVSMIYNKSGGKGNKDKAEKK